MAMQVDGQANGSAKQDEKTSADYYFDSYSHFGIHEEMLKDVVRTKTYMNSIVQNGHIFKGKTVLDIGCGTGILSLFAAKAGAAHVYGIECSSIAEQARQIVADNGFSDKVTIVHGKVEEVELPVDKVDIIISEWMGYFLLYESMLDTVIWARDKWLKPGGMIFPDQATLYIAAIEDGQYKHDKIDFWDNVYGFDFSCIRSLAMSEPLVDTVEATQLASGPCTLATFDINTMTKSDATFSMPFKLTARRNDFVHALVAWFDVSFGASHKPIGFSTSPDKRPTHWKQTVFYLEDTLTICQGETITGRLECKPNGRNPRDLDISIEYKMDGKHSSVNRTQEYRMR